jgi:ubiquinone biosynthesis protein
MIPHVSRLLELWRIAAHYRLDTLFPAEELPEKARHALGVIRMHPAAWSSRERKNPLKLKQALEEMGPLAIKMGNRRNARPVKTANMSTDQMKQMYRLRVPRMFPKKI